MIKIIQNASIALKVALAPSFAIICLAIVSSIGFYANYRSSASLYDIGNYQLKSIITAAELSQQLGQIHGSINQSLAWEGTGFKAQKIEELDKKIISQLVNFEKNLVKAVENPTLKLDDADKLRISMQEFKKYQDNAKSALEIKSGMVANAASYMTTMDASFESLKKNMDQLVKSQMSQVSQSVEKTSSQAEANQIAITMAFIIALTATLAIATLMSKMIVRPLEDASRVANAVADGDLTIRPTLNPSTDATGQVVSALSEVSSRLANMVNDIRNAAEHVSRGTSEIAGGNSDLSVRTEKTAASLQETAASIEELSATINNTADNAREANNLAREASEVAQEGGRVVGEVISTMSEINAQAKKIGDIVGVIDGIAFQTNILALNAAVEAARAGEQGRGFSVVASEVRTLAQSSAGAAKEIKLLIGSSVDRINTGVLKVEAAGKTMDKIVASISKVSSTMGEISNASSQQAAGIAQLSQGVAEMDRSTQQNAALVEEASAATESLRNEASTLVRLLSQFRT